jgi:hypothetical protein
MALPALGVAARLLASKGTREAVKKYGTKAVDEAKKQIAKRQTAIDKSAKGATDKALGTTKRPRSKTATQLRQANKGPAARNKTTLKKNNPPGFTGTKTQLAAAKKVSDKKAALAKNKRK